MSPFLMLRGKTHSQWLAFLWCVSLTNTDLVLVLVLAHTNHVAPGNLISLISLLSAVKGG